MRPGIAADMVVGAVARSEPADSRATAGAANMVAAAEMRPGIAAEMAPAAGDVAAAEAATAHMAAAEAATAAAHVAARRSSRRCPCGRRHRHHHHPLRP